MPRHLVCALAALSLPACTKADDRTDHTVAVRGPTPVAATATFAVTGMACEKCAARIARELQSEHGVASAEVDFQTARLRVSYDPKQIDPARIIAAVERIGFRAEVRP